MCKKSKVDDSPRVVKGNRALVSPKIISFYEKVLVKVPCKSSNIHYQKPLLIEYNDGKLPSEVNIEESWMYPSLIPPKNIDEKLHLNQYFRKIDINEDRGGYIVANVTIKEKKTKQGLYTLIDFEKCPEGIEAKGKLIVAKKGSLDNIGKSDIIAETKIHKSDNYFIYFVKKTKKNNK